MVNRKVSGGNRTWIGARAQSVLAWALQFAHLLDGVTTAEARTYLAKGRVFYTAMDHREDVWTNPAFQQVLLGGIAWALGKVDADITPNITQVTPKAGQLP